MADTINPSTAVTTGSLALPRQAVDAAVARRPRKNNTFRIVTYVVISLAAFVYLAPFAWMLSKSMMSLFEANSTAVIPSHIMLFAIFLLTIFVPETVTLVPNLVTVSNISHTFEAINPALKWTDNWPALVIPYLSSTFSIFLLRQFFRQIPDDLWDAARLDGAGHLRFLFQIVVPISRAAVTTSILFSFVGVWSALQWPLLVTSSQDWRPLAVALQQYRAADAGDQTHLLMAASVIALLPVLLLYFIAQKQFTQGIATTGLKG